MQPNVAVARLNYPYDKSNTVLKIMGSFDLCFDTDRCTFANCPFPMTAIPNITCLPLVDLTTSTEVNNATLQTSYSSDFQEIFINIFEKTQLNGFTFEYPKVPPGLVHRERDVITECPSICEQKQCSCSQYFSIALNSTMQIVLANIDTASVKNENEPIEGYAHPMHIHGYHFYVIKVLYD